MSKFIRIILIIFGIGCLFSLSAQYFEKHNKENETTQNHINTNENVTTNNTEQNENEIIGYEHKIMFCINLETPSDLPPQGNVIGAPTIHKSYNFSYSIENDSSVELDLQQYLSFVGLNTQSFNNNENVYYYEEGEDVVLINEFKVTQSGGFVKVNGSDEYIELPSPNTAQDGATWNWYFNDVVTPIYS